MPAYVWRGYKGSKLGSVGGGQTDRWPAYPAPTILPQCREGGPPTWMGPGKEWLLRMDSESLDEEESRAGQPAARLPAALSSCPVASLGSFLVPRKQRTVGETLCCSFVACPPGFFFFCLISVVSNPHEMTIKGFYNEKSHFYWLGFLSSGQGPVRGQRVLKHKVTVSCECELGSDGAHALQG